MDIGNGLIWKAHALEFSLEVDPSATFLSGSPFEGYVATGELVCSSLLSTGLGGGPVPDLVISVTVTEETGAAEITGRIGPISRTRGSGGGGGASVTFYGVKVFARPNFAEWRLTYDTCEVRVFGVLVATLAAGEFFSYGTVVAPGYIPLLGMPVQVFGTAQASSATGGTSPPTFESGAEVTATVSGGWRFKETSLGAWQSLPVTPYDNLSTPAGSLSLAGIIVSSSTYGAHVVAYAKTRQERQATGTCPFGGIPGPGEREDAAKNGRVWLVPDLECAFERMDEPRHGALYIRSAFPWTQAQATALIQPLGSGFGTPYETIRDVHPSRPKVTFQAVAGAAPEETQIMDADRFSPIIVGASTSFASAALVDPCDDMLFPNTQTVSESVGVLFPFAVRSWTGSGPEAGELRNVDAIARYWQTWCHPHWSFAMPQIPWELDGSPTPWTDYWGVIGSQQLDDPAIDEPLRTRNHIVSDLLELDNPWTGWQDAAAGGRRWPGITRWFTRQIVPRASFTYSAAQSELISVTGGTITHGASMVASPSGSTMEILIEMDSWTVQPYLWALIANKVRLDWIASNVSAMRLFAEGQDGSRILIAENADLKNTKKPIPPGASTTYAGSWGIENGAGVTSEIGVDVAPGGSSVATMSAPDRAANFQLLPARSRRRLVIELTVTVAGTSATINYPELFHELDAAPYVMAESRQIQTLLLSKAGHARVGNLDHFLPSRGWITVADVEGAGFRPSIVDGLGLLRMLFLGEDKELLTVDEAAAIFDPYEPNNLGALESMSSAWMLPTQQLSTYSMALVWGPREVPPLASWPRRRRNTVTWLEDGGWTQRSYIWAQMGSRYAVSSSRPVEIKGPPGDDTVYTSPETGAPSGWSISRFLAPLTNSEPATWRVFHRGAYFARLKPWRGHFAVFGLDAGEKDCHLCMWPSDGRLIALVSHGAESKVLRLFAAGSIEALEFPGDAVVGQIAVSPSAYLVATTVEGASVVRRYSVDWGENWSTPQVITSGEEVALAIDDGSGEEFAVVYDAGVYKCWSSRDQGTTWAERGTIVSDDKARGGLEFAGDGHRSLVFLLGGTRRFVSTNSGANWTET